MAEGWYAVALRFRPSHVRMPAINSSAHFATLCVRLADDRQTSTSAPTTTTSERTLRRGRDMKSLLSRAFSTCIPGARSARWTVDMLPDDRIPPLSVAGACSRPTTVVGVGPVHDHELREYWACGRVDRRASTLRCSTSKIGICRSGHPGSGSTTSGRTGSDQRARRPPDSEPGRHGRGPPGGVAAPAVASAQSRRPSSQISSEPVSPVTPRAACMSNSNSPATSGPGRKSSTGGNCARESSPSRSKKRSVVP
jgi:hypothetical protein